MLQKEKYCGVIMKKAAKWLLCINLLAWTLLAVQVLTVNMEQRVAQNTVPVQNGDVQAKGEDADAVKKKVALTFDDGPDPDYTEMLLDGLKKRNVKATFFLLGKQAEAYPDIVKRMHKEGHMIGNHSYDHVNLANLSKTDAAKQIWMTSEAIHKITGEYPQYLRPPFGNEPPECSCAKNMMTVLWDVDPLDWCCGSSSTVIEKVVKAVEEDDIILLHDASESSVEAALGIIDALEKQGYELIDQCQRWWFGFE